MDSSPQKFIFCHYLLTPMIFFPLFMKNVLVALLHKMKWDPLCQAPKCQKLKLYKCCPHDLYNIASKH